MKSAVIGTFLLAGISAASGSPGNFERDTFSTAAGELAITSIGHASLMFELDKNGTPYVIFIDPVGSEADYSQFPKADLILVTHHHSDHLDPSAIGSITKRTTVIISNPEAAKGRKWRSAENGALISVDGISVKAVPAYNTTAGRERFHPKGRDNGYVIDFYGTKVFVSGDSEDIPEYGSLGDIRIAFLPVNQPYTMTLEQAARAAKMIHPDILYPYHYSGTPVEKLKDMLAGTDIEVRIRSLE